MALTKQLKNQHLLWRSGFGPSSSGKINIDNSGSKELWGSILRSSLPQPQKLIAASNTFNDYLKGTEGYPDELKKLSKEQRKALGQQSREDIKKLNILWLTEMITSDAQLREKMSLFWHGHFACRIDNIFFEQDLLHIIRTNALENFGDMLRGVSKSPAMLQFLNNQQNKKKHPNENFAREVMELFTMGRGNYTENDIKEAARAFTGWGFDVSGTFIFRENQHDDGLKTFLGKTGNFNGDDIITILLEQKQTAKYISKKIYRYFVNEKVNESICESLSNRFYKNGYDIKKLMEDIFTSEWFYDEKNIGTKIKSPVELIAGIRRMLPLHLEDETAQLLIQRALGQVLFYPPNVAGWPGGKSWIDSSTLMLRLRIPQMITADEFFNIRPKSDDDMMMGQMMEQQIAKKQNKKFIENGGTATINWTTVTGFFEKVQKENLLPAITNALLQTHSRVNNNIILKYLNNESRENYIKSAIISLMSTPEYQLC